MELKKILQKDGQNLIVNADKAKELIEKGFTIVKDVVEEKFYTKDEFKEIESLIKKVVKKVK